MPANPLRGEGEIVLDGRSYPLRFTWTVLAELEAKYPKGWNPAQVAVLADLISWGVRHIAPELTPEAIMNLSPPIDECIEPIMVAFRRAYRGNKEEEPETENPPMAPASRPSNGAETSPSEQGYRPNGSGA